MNRSLAAKASTSLSIGFSLALQKLLDDTQAAPLASFRTIGMSASCMLGVPLVFLRTATSTSRRSTRKAKPLAPRSRSRSRLIVSP